MDDGGLLQTSAGNSNPDERGGSHTHHRLYLTFVDLIRCVGNSGQMAPVARIYPSKLLPAKGVATHRLLEPKAAELP
ncbi:hypothetical protein CRG98_026571 [Punica granatum]|uniref:Uncharacterized protein n=1 Tax=Punica granatum TaxID=22663 RepID=A0A2I0J9Q3_PUNGR|nr:hypothetical protein CRG98_026571 [Punica granatum]